MTRADERTKTFIDTRGRIPTTVGQVRVPDEYRTAATVYVARYSKTKEELALFLEILGLV